MKTVQDYYEDYVADVITDLLDKSCSIIDDKLEVQLKLNRLGDNENYIKEDLENVMVNYDNEYIAIHKLIEDLQKLI